MTIPAKPLICELNEVDVLRSVDISSTSEKTVKVQQQQQTVSEESDIKFDLNDSCLNEAQKKHKYFCQSGSISFLVGL